MNNTNKVKPDVRHLIYTYKDKVYQSHKRWTFSHCEEVLTRLGASYWEIG